MGKRATFTQADLGRAIAAADKAGKVAIQTPMGIAFLDPAALPVATMPPEESAEVDTCAGKFGRAR